MEKKTLTIILSISLIVFSISLVAYTVNFLNQQKKEQHAQLQSVISTINTQALEIKKLQTKLTILNQPLVNNNSESIAPALNQDNPHAELQNQLQQQVNSLHEKLEALDKEIQNQAQELSRFALSQQDNIAANIESSEEPLDTVAAQEDTEKLIQKLEHHWQQQVAAPEWAQGAEIAARESFAQAKGLELSHVSCKTDLCKLEITPTAEAEVSPSEWLITNTPVTEDIEMYTQTKNNADGSESVVIYLSREGKPLSEIN